MSSGRGPIAKKVRPLRDFPGAAKKNEFKDHEDIVNSVGFFFNNGIPAVEAQELMAKVQFHPHKRYNVPRHFPQEEANSRMIRTSPGMSTMLRR